MPEKHGRVYGVREVIVFWRPKLELKKHLNGSKQHRLSYGIPGVLHSRSGSKLRLKWSEVVQSCPTVCDPMDCSLPGSSVRGIFQARVLEWVAISFSRGSSWPRDRTWVSCIAHRRFTIRATGKPSNYQCCHKQKGTEFPIPGSIQAEASESPAKDIIKWLIHPLEQGSTCSPCAPRNCLQNPVSVCAEVHFSLGRAFMTSSNLLWDPKNYPEKMKINWVDVLLLSNLDIHSMLLVLVLESQRWGRYYV